MKRRFVAAFTLLAVLTLVGCGADGEPQTPPIPPGVTITGTVEFGVGGNF